MDSKSDLPAGDPETEKPVNDAEYNSLLDMNEKQEFPSDECNTSNDKAIDIEAGHPAPESEEALTSKAPRPPMSREEAQALRIIPMDNIRTIAISLITLQNVAIHAVSTHRDAAHLHQTHPAWFVLISLFVGMTRLLAVPTLFFVAGFSSKFSMVMHSRSSLRFALRRTWKTAQTIVLYQAFAYLAKVERPLPPAETATSTPYYISREGLLAALNGPTAYILAILALDYVYAISRAVNALMSSPAKPTPPIITELRYAIVKSCLVAPIYMWVSMWAFGVMGETMLPEGSTASHWLYAANSAELHFPFFYLIAYTAGIHFHKYSKFIFAAAQPKGASKSQSSPTRVLFIRLTIATILLYAIYHTCPEFMVPFLDVRLRPTIPYHTSGAGLLYAYWVFFVLLAVPDAMFAAFFTHRVLSRDWGRFSRTAHFQVYAQMLYLAGDPFSFYADLPVRWLVPGGLAIYDTYLVGIIVLALRNLTKRGWCAIRSCIGKKTDQSIST